MNADKRKVYRKMRDERLQRVLDDLKEEDMPTIVPYEV